MRTVFFGTPRFAVPSLEALLSRHEVSLVVSQPDRPAGRGLALRQSAVAEKALAAGVAVLKPGRARDPEAVAAIEAARPEVLVVAAYGQLLPAPLLNVARHGAINVHASLLPRWRGASPISAAILAGDPQTGVSIMQMDEGLDTGPVLLQRATPIGEQEDAESLTDRLAELGAVALLEALAMVSEGVVHGHPQSAEGVTHAGRVKKGDGHLEWTLGAEAIARSMRAYHPWPGVRLALGGETVQVTDGRPVPAWWVGAGRGQGPAGSVLDVTPEGIVMASSSTPFLVRRVKPAGKREMAAVEYARGRRDLVVAP